MLISLQLQLQPIDAGFIPQYGLEDINVDA